jgi:O-antigen/teichoic acid export membrane protein
MPAAPILAVLAFVGLLDATNTLAEPVLMARGALKSLSLVFLVNAAILVPTAILLVSSIGAIGAAYAMVLSGCAALVMYYFAGRREIGYRFRDLGRYLWRPLLSSVLMAAAVRSLETLLVGDGVATLPVLFGLVTAGVVIYLSLMLLFWLVARRPPFPELMLLELALGYLKSRNGKPVASL